MTEHTNMPEAARPHSSVPAPASDLPAKTRRKWPWVVGGLAAVLISGAVAAQTFAPHFGPGFMGHGMMSGRNGMMQHQMDPARMADFADRGVRHMAVELDATVEQQEKLRAIVRDLVKDIAPLHTARQDAAARARASLSQLTVDGAEIEKFRVEHLAKADAVSKRITLAITEAAEILTPEQRRKLANRLAPTGAGPFWRRG